MIQGHRWAKRRGRLFAAVIFAAALDVLLHAFRAKIPTSPLLLIVPLTGVSLAVVAVFCRKGVLAARLKPLLVMAVAIATTWLVPLYWVGVQYEFWIHAAEREQIVRMIETGKGNTISRPGFPLRYAASMDGISDVSAGACKAPAGVCVEFVEFPGFLGGYAGFLYVPDGGEPSAYVEGNSAFAARHWSGNWYFVND